MNISKQIKEDGNRRRITDLKILVDKLIDSTNLGFAVYFDDQYDEASPLIVSEGQTVVLDINASSSVVEHLPNGVSDVYDVATSSILPIKRGDGLAVAINFDAKNSLTDGTFRSSIDIGGSFGQLFPQKGRFDSGANVYEPFYFPVIGYQLDTFIANKGQLKITGVKGSTSIIFPQIQIHRLSVGK